MSGINGNWNFRTGGPDMDPGFDTPGAGAAPNSTPAEAPVTRSTTGPVALGGGEWSVRFADGAAPAAAAQAGRAPSMPLVKQGSKGEDVKELQTKLNEFRAKIGLDQLPVTGNFGPQTREAVVQFQKMWGLDADGAVGAATWRRALGEANPAPATPAAGSIQAKVMAHKEAI